MSSKVSGIHYIYHSPLSEKNNEINFYDRSYEDPRAPSFKHGLLSSCYEKIYKRCNPVPNRR